MTERLEAVEGNLIVLRQAVEVLTRLDDVTYATGGAAPDEDSRRWGCTSATSSITIAPSFRGWRAARSTTTPASARTPWSRIGNLPSPPRWASSPISAGCHRSWATRPIRITVRSVAGDHAAEAGLEPLHAQAGTAIPGEPHGASLRADQGTAPAGGIRRRGRLRGRAFDHRRAPAADVACAR